MMRVLCLALACVAVAATPRTRRDVAPLVPETPCNQGRDVCVPYYQCNTDDGSILTDGTGIFDIRLGGAGGTDTGQDVISECPNYLDVCCNDPTRSKPEPPARYVSQCGRRNEEGVNVHITGFQDNQAQFGEFPWMAAVLKREYVAEKQDEKYVCGGSLIHPQVILTGAHCVASLDSGSLIVRLGEWDTRQANEVYPHQDRQVNYVKLHQGFKPNNLHNDFALLFLDNPVELSLTVDTICLPQQDYTIPENTYCWATGWGKERFGEEELRQNVLKEIQLPLVEQQTCQSSLRTTKLGTRFQLDDSFTCAGGEAGIDTCTGDGGSPLVCELIPGQLSTLRWASWPGASDVVTSASRGFTLTSPSPPNGSQKTSTMFC